MKKLVAAVTLTMLVVASSFTPKFNSIHETKVEADIVDLAVSQDFLSTLVAAVKAGDLVDVLKGDGPFTVFAPTNEAFAQLPAGTVESLLKPENKEKLVKILTYHVVPGKVLSSDLKNGQMAKTVEGSSVKVTLKDGKAMINDATVVNADIMADNGVVHVIDKVILPSM
ncbi:fasciclin domain-containing protein [Algoriphagus halophilus]|uniref:Uncaracterized surface protein containing fasciclin (FAS1) repeats n=1 Tax=Algoriphagus halophilus TaxID=226505 RepID=A0A1N6GLI9_9BACT|nr:fasciclin domain-containing protein [Algoriphagus halophilus]SIO08347.1 Uncaracterized surface protein containing fasciclin (FAS1) repeats [Algoriphagus halophilus]